MPDEEKHIPQLITLEEASGLIKSQDSIWVGSALGISYAFLDELSNRYDELNNVTILGHNFINYYNILVDPKFGEAFHAISFFETTPFSSLSYKTNNLEFIKKPCGLYSKTICEKYNINVIIVEVCPPDKNGNCNLGANGRAITPYLNKCEGITTKIAIINALLLPSYDNGELVSLPLSDFDYCCISKHPVLKKAEI